MTRISTPKLFIVVVALLVIAGVGFGFTRWQALQDDQPAPQAGPDTKLAEEDDKAGAGTPFLGEAPTLELDTSDWKTYRNEEFGFEIKYPESFIFEGDPSGTWFASRPKTPSPFVGDSLILFVTTPGKDSTLEDFGQAVIDSSTRFDSFQLFQQSKTTFSGRDAYKIVFTGALEYDPFLGGGISLDDELIEAVYIRHDPYIIALIVPQSIELYNDIASTLTLFDLSGGGS